MGFGSSFPLIVAHASAHAALNGAGNLCTFRRAKLLVSVRMRCRVIAPFCGGDAGLFARQPLFGNLQWCLRDFWLGSLPACRCLPSSSGCCTPRCLRSSGSASFSRLACGPFSSRGQSGNWRSSRHWPACARRRFFVVCSKADWLGTSARYPPRGGQRHLWLLSFGDKDLCGNRHSYRGLRWGFMSGRREPAGAHHNPRGL
jgi:hypothetical protein